MSAYVFDYLAELGSELRTPAWYRAEINARVDGLRKQVNSVRQVIPVFFEDLSDHDIDDVLIGIWLMNALVEIDDRVLLELDALGTALGLVGCETRLVLHVREALTGKPAETLDFEPERLHSDLRLFDVNRHG